VRSNDAVVINADGNRLCITKTIRWRVTATTRIVIVQASDGVKPEQAPKISQLIVYLATDPLFERGFDSAREAFILEHGPQFFI